MKWIYFTKWSLVIVNLFCYLLQQLPWISPLRFIIFCSGKIFVYQIRVNIWYIFKNSEKSYFLSWSPRGRVTWKQRTLKTDHTLVLPTLISLTNEPKKRCSVFEFMLCYVSLTCTFLVPGPVVAAEGLQLPLQQYLPSTTIQNRFLISKI